MLSEEEIFKILNKILEGDKDCLEIEKRLKDKEEIEHWEKEVRAIEGIINLYFKEKARADKLEKDYSKLLTEKDEEEAKVKELEEQVEYDKTHIFTPQTIKLNFIPKQMVIDKMKENKQILAKTNDGNLRERLYIENGIMKELLEGEK